MSKTKKEKKPKLALLGTMLMIGLIPLLATAVLLSAISIIKSSDKMEEDTYARLRAAAVGLEQYYAWDVINTGEAAYEHDYVDSLLDQDIELTLFLEDTRFITSIYNDAGERNEGTKADPAIYAEVLKGNEYKADNVKIGDGEYYVYYVPMKDADDNVIGMAFAGEEETKIKNEIKSTATSLVITAIVLAMAFSAIITTVSIVIRKQIVKVIKVTEKLSEGELNIDTNVSSKIKEINVLAKAAQKLQANTANVIGSVMEQVDNLDNNMNEIAEGVEICKCATEGVTSAMEEVARGSMEMAESVQNTAVSMNRIGEDITEIREHVINATTATKEVKGESNHAKSELDQLLVANKDTIAISEEVTKGIKESALAVENIRKATEMIAEIADQTALLAMNAGIEAARAGEAGRGFAVVAHEISNLASQSEKTTKDIQDVVSEIIDSSHHNVELASRIKEAVDNEGSVLKLVANSFEKVNNGIEISTQSVEGIEGRSTELDDAKGIVLDEVSTLSSISEENAASCQETNANMEELAANIETIHHQAADTKEISNQLREAISYFKV